MENKDLNQIIYEISYKPRKRLDVFRELSASRKRDVVLRVSKRIQFEIVSKLNKEELIDVLEHLDPDEATDILRDFSLRKREKIIRELNKQLKSDVSFLLQFDPATAAGLMNINYIQVESEDTIASVVEQVKIHEERTGRLPAILVMKEGKLSGCLPGYKLGLSGPEEKAGQYAERIERVDHKGDIDDVLDVFRRHPRSKVVVLGETGNVMGLIYSEDILKAMKEKETSSLYDFAGISQEESVYDNVKRKVRYRYKWLIINLGTAFLAAFTVGFFDETISKYVLLAVYMPIVAGMGGNAGTQTLAVLVRGISLKQINIRTMWRTLKSELGSSFINGLINGIIVGSVVIIKDGDFKIGLILAVAMVVNLLIAAFFGTTVPLIMRRLGKDPASSATIFITTATDVFGFMIFLGLATLFLV